MAHPVQGHSVNGESAAFEVMLSETEVYAPIHYMEYNKLTPSVCDPYSKEPSYKATPVRIVYMCPAGIYKNAE